MPLHLRYSALSDVGRVRKDNQDSGYAGPWLLTVCDGVGGAARGDMASSTAVGQLVRLDEPPGEDLLGAVAGAIHRADDRIGELVDHDPALNGTSTTMTVALFDGARVGIGHVGDSRAYLYRGGALSQLTKDHTFVQSLIDEGRITEEESRVHPHRNLILKAVDGRGDNEPDLFLVDLATGDRLFLCSDGASGVLDDERMADILGSGTPDYATVEMVRASLEAGSSDNITCIVADVVEEEPEEPLEPLLVGAAAELPRRRGTGMAAVFRGHRAGDTGELEAVPSDVPHAILSDPLDPESVRYAPRPPRRLGWLRRLLALASLVGLLWIGVAAAWAWSQHQYFVGEQDGNVTIFRGLNTDLPGISLNSPYETTDVRLDLLSDYDAGLVTQGIESADLDEAHRTVQELAGSQDCAPGDTC
ncbi:PP2C family protein-serine/threonine phosphatase [Nocardioides sp.]|uniref:PP2C family protein-serine/threonine phosphatase n=1 Tax=Nocardioides sp. TaxID=35761 RepID=UPI003D10C947